LEIKKAIYTVLIGNYDNLNPAPNFVGWDCFLFTDLDITEPKGWNVIKVNEKLDSKKLSRKIKILGHEYLPDYNLLCYIDANITLGKKPPSHPLYVKHPNRNTVTAECEKVILLGKDEKSIVLKQLDSYTSDGFPDNFGLYQNGFFVRENNAETNLIYNAWWIEVKKHSYRDQISFPYVLWKLAIHLYNTYLDQDVKKYYKIHPHIAKPINNKSITVHHITPGHSNKNIGKAINDLIRGLPLTDWVCLRDIDTLPMSHKTFFAQCEKIAMNGKADLVSCVTNRLGLKYQLYKGEFSENADINYHVEIGEKLANQYDSEVEIINDTIGGLMMLFSVRLWRDLGGFPEGAISIDGKFFDWHFSNAVLEKGYKIGIAKGIYLFHLYRWGTENPKHSTIHLY
jgi:hypothetical protein